MESLYHCSRGVNMHSCNHSNRDAKRRTCNHGKGAWLSDSHNRVPGNPVTMATGVRPWSRNCCTGCVIYSTCIYTRVACIGRMILLLYYCYYQSSLSLLPWGIIYNWIRVCLQIYPTLNFSCRSSLKVQHLCSMCKGRFAEKITNLACRRIYDQTILFSAR